MKKRLLKIVPASAALAAALLLCGCGKLPFAQKIPDFGKTYTVSADITYDKLKAKAEITRVNGSEWEVKFTEPQQLCGVTVDLNEKSCAVSFEGLSVSAANNSVYMTAPRLIAECLSQLISAQAEELSEEDGVLTYSGTLDGKRITVAANAATGDLISLKCPYQKLSVNFSEQRPFTLTLPDEGAIS